MTRTTKRWLALPVFVLLVGGVGFGYLAASYGLGYVVRVLVHRDADAGDFLWKASAGFAGSPQPRALESAASAEAVRRAFEALPRVASLDSFMEDSGSTALIVLREGRILLEAYYHGRDAASLSPTFSVSKSLLSLLAGQAIARGELQSVEDSIVDYVPELAERDPRFRGVTIAHLLDMHSGIAFDHDVSFPFVTADKPLVYYASDLRSVALKRTRIESEPGRFLYNDYHPILVGLALERVSSRPFTKRFQEDLWNAIGAEHAASWSVDDRGFPFLESGFVATARDLARVGQMMLDGGTAGPDRVISEAWHERSTHRVPEQDFGTHDGRQWGYRNGWWLIYRPQPPHDYSAIGRFGQYVYVSPAHRVVVVRTGFDRIGLSDPDFTAMFYAVAERLGRHDPAEVADSVRSPVRQPAGDSLLRQSGLSAKSEPSRLRTGRH